MSKHNWYDPEAERTCRGCYKHLKTKEGVLEAGQFTCSPCHSWYKARGLVRGAVIFVIILIIVAILVNDD